MTHGHKVVIVRLSGCSDQIGIYDVPAIRAYKSKGIPSHILDDNLYPAVFNKKVIYFAFGHGTADQVIFIIDDFGQSSAMINHLKTKGTGCRQPQGVFNRCLELIFAAAECRQGGCCTRRCHGKI